MANLKEMIYSHTPAGRYQEYRAKNDYLLSQTQGEARYMFEKKLDREAKYYAAKKVATEIIGTALFLTGAFVVGKEIQKGELKKDIRKIEKSIREFPTKIKIGYAMFLAQSGQMAGQGFMSSVEDKVPSVIARLQPEAEVLGSVVAKSAVQGMQDGLGDVLKAFQAQIELTLANAKVTLLSALFGKNKK